MGLYDRIEQDLHTALKAGNELETATLRMVKSDIMYEKARTGAMPAEEQVLEVVTRAAKRRKESIAEFEKAGRNDLAEREAAELQYIKRYLPEQLEGDALLDAVRQLVAAMGEVSAKDMGRVMGSVMKELKGRADGNNVKSCIQQILEGK